MGKLRCFLGTLAAGARRAAQQDQGQCSGAPTASLGGIRRCGYTRDPWPEPAAGESPFSRGQVLPGHSPDIDADDAIWGWARREAAGTQCLAMVQQRVNHFLAGLASPARKSNAAAGLSCYQGPRYSPQTTGPIPGIRRTHIPPRLKSGRLQSPNMPPFAYAQNDRGDSNYAIVLRL